MDNRRVFAFLNERVTAGHATILVTIIAVEGSSMRNPGTHMAVCEDGSFVGSLSGGCIENAVVAEALDALREGASRVVRFGAGSRYIDIKLPCGGGLDIHFLPLPDEAVLARCMGAIEAREPFSLRLPLRSNDVIFEEGRQEASCISKEDAAIVGHWPEPRMLIIGHGAVVASLARLARQMDLAVDALSPDQRLLDGLAAKDISTTHLTTPADTAKITADPWTAIIFLFHDHDWEIALMASALTSPHFYIGAMGGRKAHAFRREALAGAGCSEEAIATIHAPIGLFHSSRDPYTLALSTLGQVIQSYHQQSFCDA